MLSGYASSGSMVEEANLKKCLDYIIKDKSRLSIKSAALVHDSGNIVAATKNLKKVPHDDFKELQRTFHSPSMFKITFGGVTYCFKSQTANQIVSFNGQNYLIVSRTEHAYIIVICQSRQKSAVVAPWINKVAQKLRDRHS